MILCSLWQPYMITTSISCFRKTEILFSNFSYRKRQVALSQAVQLLLAFLLFQMVGYHIAVVYRSCMIHYIMASKPVILSVGINRLSILNEMLLSMSGL